jgi:hypothetical protein
MTSNGKAVTASIAGPDGSYAMFEAHRIDPRGAFLAGTLLLELDEEFTVELSFADASRLRVRARVDRVQRDVEPGMTVSFSDLSEADRKLLADKLGV